MMGQLQESFASGFCGLLIHKAVEEILKPGTPILSHKDKLAFSTSSFEAAQKTSDSLDLAERLPSRRLCQVIARDQGRSA